MFITGDRETERQRDRETERQRDRETERQRDREIERERERKRKRDRLICMFLYVSVNVYVSVHVYVIMCASTLSLWTPSVQALPQWTHVANP